MGSRPDVNIPRTSSNPGEKSTGELGYISVLGFSQVDSAQSRCGAVELDLRRANCPPGEIGAEECDYIMTSLLTGSSDLECLSYQGKDCIKDFSAGGTLSPSVSDLSGPRGLYVTDGPVGHPGTLSSSTFMTEILMDPGGMLPSSDLAGMLLPAIPVSPAGFWGTLSLSDSDPVGQDGPYGADGPIGHLGTLSLSTSVLAYDTPKVCQMASLAPETCCLHWDWAYILRNVYLIEAHYDLSGFQFWRSSY